MRADIVLPAAGTGERMNLPIAKQFVKVLGKPVLAYTIDCFHRLSWVRHIVVVVSQDQTAFTSQLMKSYGFSRVIVCVGSHSRHRSIWSGLKSLEAECSSCDVVIIHDAARPFVSEDLARQVVEAAAAYGAAGVTRPLVSTVIRPGDDRKLVESLDRRLYRNSEMPQAFHYGVITSAYQQSSNDDLDHGTECLLLALKYSQHPAALVEGDDDLWKVTYQKDIYSMESVVKEKLMTVSIIQNCHRKLLALDEFVSRLRQGQIKIADSPEFPANTVVIVQDNQTTQNTEEVAARVSSLYERDHPLSVVRLDLMLVIVFLRDVQSSPLLPHREALTGLDQKDGVSQASAAIPVPRPHTNQMSVDFHQHSLEQHLNTFPPTQNLDPDPSLPAGRVVDPSAQNLNPGPSLPAGRVLDQYRRDQDSNAVISPTGPTFHSTIIDSHSVGSTLPGRPVLPIWSDTSRSDDSSIIVNLSSEDSSLQGGSTDQYDSTEVHHSSTTTSSHADYFLSPDPEGSRIVMRCRSVVHAMKTALKACLNRSCASIVVGVVCSEDSAMGQKLAELVWQRSLCMDKQVLMFDNPD